MPDPHSWVGADTYALTDDLAAAIAAGDATPADGVLVPELRTVFCGQCGTDWPTDDDRPCPGPDRWRVGGRSAPARNSPCPCGSGLKFKRCGCGGKRGDHVSQ